MKKLTLLLSILLIGISQIAVAQTKGQTKGQASEKKRDSLPCEKFPKLPAFNLLAMDSSTIFNTYNIPEGKPTVLMFYSPDCDHCQHLAEQIMQHMDSLKSAEFYLLTPMTIAATKEIDAKYHVTDFKNMHLYKDYEFFFPHFFGANYVPYLAVYDKHKMLVKLYEGGANMSVLIKAVNQP